MNMVTTKGGLVVPESAVPETAPETKEQKPETWTSDDRKRLRNALKFLDAKKMRFVLICNQCESFVNPLADPAGRLVMTCDCTRRVAKDI